MEKVSKIINLLTIVIGLAVAILAYLLITAVDQLRKDTSAKQSELDAAITTLAKTEEKSAADKAALSATKSGLADDLSDHRREVTRLKDELPVSEAKLEGLKKQQEEARAEAEKKKGEVTGLQTEIAGVQEAAGGLRAANPTARAAVEQMRNEIREQNDLAVEIQSELRDYKQETAHLKVHFASILKELQQDARDPSWITIGKSVNTRIERLSMETGMLVLPLGITHGMREDMKFIVSKKGKRVGQLVIKETGLAHSVANIVPLIGNPTKLRERDDIEITGF